MEGQLMRSSLMIFCLCSVIRATVSEIGANDTLYEVRQPRVIGRIVKLYSGVHPEPVYCSQEGFQGDPVHCAIFYRCVKAASGKYTVFRFQCGPGTIYDPDVETCNFPQRAKRTNCGIFGSDRNQADTPRLAPSSLELPTPISPNPIYTPFVGDSSKVSLTTLYPWATSPPKKLQSPFQSASTTNVWNTAAPQSLPLKVTIATEGRQGSDPCTKDGFMGDSENCHKFYRCVGNQRGGFIRYEFSCSESTVWDEDAQNCNHAWAVQKSRCRRTSTNVEKEVYSKDHVEDSANTIQQQLQLNYGNKVSQTQTQISHGSVTQNQTQINYGNRDNKHQSSKIKQNQTQVSYGSAVSQTQTQINHGNNAVQTQSQIDHTKDSSQTQTSSTSGDSEDDEDQGYGKQPAETSNTSQSTNTGNENNECTESGFIGDSVDCKRFYRCVDNGKGGFIKYDFTCGEGTVWDSSIESCNHAWAVPKCGGKAPQTSSTQAATTTTVKSTESSQPSIHPATTDDYEDPGYGNQNQQQEQPSSTASSSISTTKQPPNNEPIESDKCKSSGFMGDKNNCKKFYRCVDNGKGGYTQYEFSCGEGTVWDSKIEACNHAWAVEKCGQDDSDIYKETTISMPDNESPQTTSNLENGYPGQSSPAPVYTGQPQSTLKPIQQQSTKKPASGKECSQEGFVGDEDDCKKFYRCVDNGRGGFIKYEFSCGEGTIWDSEITSCNHPNSVKKACSGETSNQSESISETTEESSTPSTDAPSAEPPGISEKPSTSKPSPGNECSQEGFMGDRNNCKKFYRCVDNGKGGFIKYEFSCGEGTVWDQELNTCNHPSQNMSCGGISIEGAEQQHQEDETNTESTGTQPSEQITTEKSSKKPQSSTDDCTSEGFYGDSSDCKRFYRCVDNGKGGYTKYEFSCGDGTVWNQEVQTCDHPSDNQNCSYGASSDSQATQSPNNTTDEVSSTTLQENTTQTPQPPSKGSGGNCTSEGFYANPDECKKFYRCVDNGKGGYIKYDFSCGEGTVWVQEIQACDHDTDGTCGSSQSESVPLPENGSGHHSSSSTTESSGTKPPDKQEDEKPDDAENSKPNDKCEKEGYYGNSQDCTKFYRCVDNGKGGLTKYDFDCGEGTIWDQDVQTCNHPRDVAHPSCQQSTGSESTTSSSTTSLSSSTGSSSTSSSSSSSSTAEGDSGSDCSTKKPANKNVNCTKAGYYPDPDDCKKFYRCVDWDGNGEKFSVYHFECGEGTIWDPALDTCNHEDSVYPPRDCSGSQTQSATEESTTAQNSTSEITTEQSGTEQSTTEQTTTEESTTSAQTTQSSEKTTTEQSTVGSTTQQTEQSTTEKTTTQESTTSKQTEQTTTEKSTTSQATTSQQTIAQQTDETTTQQSTTEQSTTSSSEQTTSPQTEGTTQDSTTNESTTEQSTEPTTQESTTKQSTTAQTDDGGTTESSTPTTESSESSTTESGGEQTTESSSSEKECPKTEDDQNLFVCPTSFKRHPKYCNMFYQCTEDDDTHDVQIATFRCPNETIYDESQTKCVDEKKADKKCDGEIAQKRRIKRFDVVYKEPITISNERLQCPASGHYPFEKENCSPAFLKCQKNKSGKLRGYVYQCPQNYVYWSVSRRCEHKDHMKDCKKSHNDWSGRWEIPIERRNVAP